MTAEQLLGLYPRAWRRRYGDELLDTAGADRLSVQQIIDITMGAIDAWLSPNVRRAAAAESTTPVNQKGRIAMLNAKVLCSRSRMRITVRDQIISAIVMLAGTSVLVTAGIWLRRSGYHVTGEAVKAVAFPLALMLSMPFGILKGQPWRAQAAVVGGTGLFLILIAFVSTKI